MPCRRMSALLAYVLFGMGLVLAGSTVQAQPPAADPQGEFAVAVADYKEAMRHIEAMRGEYQTADPAQRAQLNEQLKELVAATQVKVDRMTDAALKAYQAAPEADSQIADLLVDRARYLMVGERPVHPQTGEPIPMGGNFFGGDQPELALPVIQALIEGGNSTPELPAWGGVAAVLVNDYDLAETYLRQAKGQGLFEGLPQFPSPEMDPATAIRVTAREYFGSLAAMRAIWQQEQEIRAAEAAADDLPRVKFTTNKGEIVVELFENEAPIATANMVSLVKQGFYDGVVFHRVLPNFMAQGGDPTGTGTGGPGYTIECECGQANARQHFRGSLSMAHAGPNTGGSQFFLTFVPTSFLDGRHTVFGRVIDGMEVLGRLQRIDPSAEGPAPEPDKILQAEVLRDRGHSYPLEKRPGR